MSELSTIPINIELLERIVEAMAGQRTLSLDDSKAVLALYRQARVRLAADNNRQIQETLRLAFHALGKSEQFYSAAHHDFPWLTRAQIDLHLRLACRFAEARRKQFGHGGHGEHNGRNGHGPETAGQA